MEFCFSPQSLISSSLSSPKPSIRRDFLGCSHLLLPATSTPLPPSKCSKIRIRRTSSSSHALIVKASFASDSVILLVSVSAFSAVSFAYITNTTASNQNSKLAFGSLNYQLSRFGIVKHIVRGSGSDVGDIHSEIAFEELVEESTKNGYVFEGKETQETHVDVLENNLTGETSVSVEYEASNLSPSPGIGPSLAFPRGISWLT